MYSIQIKQITDKEIYLFGGSDQTLDNIDGKQARRTGSSTPLGELFDHGMDSISTILLANVNIIALNACNDGWISILMYTLTILTFYMAMWGVFLTGKLTFGFFDVTEAQWTSIILLTAVFFVSPSFFDKYFMIGSVEFKIRYFIYIAMLLTFANYLRTHVTYLNEYKTTQDGGNKYLPAIPLLIMSIYIVFTHLAAPEIVEKYPIMYFHMFGFVFSKMSNRLIVAHMSKTPFSMIETGYLGPLFTLVCVYIPNNPISTETAIYISLGYVILDLVWYMANVYNEIATFLEIKIFTIPYPPKVEDQPVPSNRDDHELAQK